MNKAKTALLASVVGLSITGMSATANASTYQVQENDTLWKISKNHGIPLTALQSANPNVDALSLQPGESLEIPELLNNYVIKQGDTFWKLSRTYNVPLAQILSANPGVEPTNLLIGSTVKIPAVPKAQGNPSAVSIQPKTETLTVPAASAKTSAAAPAAKAPTAKAPAAQAPAAKAPAAQAPSSKSAIAPSSNTVTTVSGQALAYDRVISAKSTAYTTSPDGNGGWTGRDFMGKRVNVGTVAVDPSVIPLGSKLYITGYDFAGLPKGGMIATASDTGGAIKGNKIDIFVPTSQQQAMTFGVQNVKVYILQ